jgi:ribosomal protein S13
MKKINRLINHLTFKKTLKDKIIKLRMFVINDLKNYVYIRYVNGYPVRGQRTHTNSKTRKRLMMTSFNNFS